MDSSSVRLDRRRHAHTDTATDFDADADFATGADAADDPCADAPA